MSLDKKLKLIPIFTSFLVFILSGSLLFAWIFLPNLKEQSPITMKVNTCIGLILGAVSLYFSKSSPCRANRQDHLVGKGFAIGVMLIGLLSGFQYLSGSNLGIDELIVRDFSNDESQLHPGRMSPIAALCFIFLGLALLSQDFRIKYFNFNLVSFFLVPVLLISFLALVGYLYGASSFYQLGPYIRIAWQTALCFYFLALGIFFSRPQSGLIAIVISPEGGGIMARRLLPSVIILPITLGWLRLKGQQLDFFGLEQGLAFIVVIMVVLFTFIIALNAKSLNKLGLERNELLKDEKKARELAELEREKLHSLFLQAPAIISLTHGPDHIFELFNNEARKTLSGRDITGLSIREGLPELEGKGFFEALDSAYQSGKPILLKEIQADLKQADGSYIKHYFNVVYHPYRNLDGKVAGILNISVDVTEAVLARQKVEEALTARDEFMSIASHELKTPITSLKLQLQLTKREIKPELGIVPSAEKLQKVLDVLDKQLSRLTTLIENILDVALIHSGKLSFDLHPVNLASLIRDVVEKLTDSLDAAKSLVSVQVSHEVIGNWDRMRLEQVITNLLMNAITYAPGSLIEIIAKENPGFVQVTVRDRGPGILKVNQTNLFKRFERAGVSRNISGLGLGLYISKQIIESHGGKIQMESEEGYGASLIFDLPLKPLNGTDLRES